MNDLVASVRALLDYDPKTGVFIWRVHVGKRIRAGTLAGSVGPFGRRSIKFTADGIGHRFLASRLAWLYVHGRLPSEEIDHINLDQSDNRISNLREAARAQNGANRRGYGRDGLKGSYKRGSGWIAQITFNRQPIYLGRFKTQQDANQAYIEAAVRLYGEFSRAA